MKLSRRTLVKTAVAGTVLTAGCGQDDVTGTTEPGDDPGESETTGGGASPGGGGEDTETQSETDGESPTETSGEGAATLQVGSHPELGDILTGPDGMTLYMYSEDSQGTDESACTDDCTGNWPPMTVESGMPEAGEGVTAELSTFERQDGSMQVTANGWPLYHFASDEEPGDAKGHAANAVWYALNPDGTPIRDDEGTGTGTSTGTGTA